MAPDRREWRCIAGLATPLPRALPLLLCVGLATAVPAHGAEPPERGVADAASTAGADPHAMHRAMQSQAAASILVADADYSVPDVVLRDGLGHDVRLPGLLDSDQPVAVNFIYTTCTTICPVMTATMLQLQRELAQEPVKPLFVSISIDPDYDTAAILRDYARRFGAEWTFLTGSRADVREVLQSFQAWRGNKTNHAAITLFRAGGGSRWVRVEGLASAKQLAAVWKRINGSS